MKTVFIFTVDVETRSDGTPEHDITGLLPGHSGRYGIEKIMNILEAAHARGTFFLNAYEIARHGEEAIANAARLIHSRGHDLELHTHPRPMYRFYGINKASMEKQVEILETGVTLLEKWTGKQAIAHRAGAFAANGRTLQACEQLGLQADCSLAPGSKVSVPLVKELGESNVVCRVGRIWEIPVTYYYPMRLGSWHSRRILDIEACSLAEIKHVTRWALRQGLPTLCLLLHSFSLCRKGKPNWCVVRRLAALLTWLQGLEGIEIATVEQLCRNLNDRSLPDPVPPAPTTGLWRTWGRAIRSWNEGWRNGLLATISAASLVAVVIGILWLSRTLLMHITK